MHNPGSDFLAFLNTTSSNLFLDPSSLSQVLVQLTGRPLMSWSKYTKVVPPKFRPHPSIPRPPKLPRPSSQESRINSTLNKRQTQLYTWSSITVQTQLPSRFTHHSPESRPFTQVQWSTPWGAHGTQSTVHTTSSVIISHKPSGAIMTSGHHLFTPILTSHIDFLTTAVTPIHKVQYSPSYTSSVTYNLNFKEHPDEQVFLTTVPHFESSALSSSNSASKYRLRPHKHSSKYDDIVVIVTNTQAKIQYSRPGSMQSAPTITWLGGSSLLPPQRLVTERIAASSEKVSTHPQITSTVYPAAVEGVLATVSPSFSNIDSVVSLTPFASNPIYVNLTITASSDDDLVPSLTSSTNFSKLSLQMLMNKTMNVNITSRHSDSVPGLILPPATVPPFRPWPTDTTGSPNLINDTQDEQTDNKCTETIPLLPPHHSITVSHAITNVSRPSSFPRPTTTTTSSLSFQTPLPLQISKIHQHRTPDSTLQNLTLAKEGIIQTEVHQINGESQTVGVEQETPTVSPSRYQVTQHTLNQSEKDIETLNQKYEVLKENENNNGSFQVIENFHNFLDVFSPTPSPWDTHILSSQKQADLSSPHLTSTDISVQTWNYQEETESYSSSTLLPHPHMITSSYIVDKIFSSTTVSSEVRTLSTYPSTSNPTLSIYHPLYNPAVALSPLPHHLVTLYPPSTNLATDEPMVSTSFPYTTITFVPNYQHNSVDLYSFLKPYSTLENAAISLNHLREPSVTTPLPDLTQHPIDLPSPDSEDGYLQEHPVSNSSDQANTGFNYADQPHVPSNVSISLPHPTRPHISNFSHPIYNPYSLHLPETPSLFLAKPSLVAESHPLRLKPQQPHRYSVTSSSNFLRPRVPPPAPGEGLTTHLMPETSEVQFRDPVESAEYPATKGEDYIF